MELNKTPGSSVRRKIFTMLLVFWCAIIIIISLGYWNSVNETVYNMALHEARSSFQKDLMYRRWASSKGGVYASVSELTPQNPYLKVKKRDITTSDSQKLTLINPAYMTRQVHEMSKGEYEHKGHITSLNPIRPGNKPDKWEETGLKLFEKGRMEYHGIVEINNKRYLRYIKAMITEESCLKCHATQGYKMGEVRGGVSVSVNYSGFDKIAASAHNSMFILYFLTGALGLVILIYGNKKIKTYENELQTKEENLFVTLQSIGDGVLVTDNTGNVVQMNPVAEKLCGVNFEEADNKSIDQIFNIVDEESGEKIISPFDSVMNSKNKVAITNHTLLRSLDGKEYYISKSAAPIRKNKEDIIGVVLVFADETEKYKQNRALLEAREETNKLVEELKQEIKERNRTEVALKQSEERLRLSLYASNQGLYDLNIQTGEIITNDQYFLMLGFKPMEFNETLDNLFLRMHENDKERVRIILNEYICGTRGEFRTEFRQYTKNGVLKWILSVGKIIEYDKNGNALRMLGLHTDIDELKKLGEDKERLQLQLHQAQKMESIGRLAGGVAHDFNNLLGVILGHCELAIVENNLNPKLKTHVIEIQTAGEKSAELTKQLLTFARKQTIDPKSINLNIVIENMLKILRRLIGENIELKLKAEPELWNVKMDTTQIDQILANLAVNSKDAINGAGEITIETMNCYVDEGYSSWNPGLAIGEYVKLMFSDTGYGMDKETQIKIFEPFFTTKGIGKGSGLGLSTVYGIIKQNNSFINVYSEPGKGTTFQIFFPRDTDSFEKQENKPKEKILPTGREKILLLEDDTTLLELERTMLESFGYNVVAFSTPSKAVEFVRNNIVDLVITDVIMPEMNGNEMLSKMKEIHPDVKCLFISGYTSDVISKHGILKEGINFIQKPFSMHNFAEKIREVFGNHI